MPLLLLDIWMPSESSCSTPVGAPVIPSSSIKRVRSPPLEVISSVGVPNAYVLRVKIGHRTLIVIVCLECSQKTDEPKPLLGCASAWRHGRHLYPGKNKFRSLIYSEGARPSGAKGTYIRKITISSTMGAGIAVEDVA